MLHSLSQALFGNCYELQPTFKQLLQRPTKLALVKKESYALCKRGVADKAQYQLMDGLESMGTLVSAITAEQEADAAAAAQSTSKAQ